MKVFVSYSGADEKWADLLRARLPQEGIEVWDFTSEFWPGDNWALKYGKGLEEADAMVVLLSPQAAQSKEVTREIQYALGAPRFRDRLVSVVVKPMVEIPWILQQQPLIRASKDANETVREVAAALKKSEALVER